MCGVPVERADDYLNRLIALGHRVAAKRGASAPSKFPAGCAIVWYSQMDQGSTQNNRRTPGRRRLKVDRIGSGKERQINARFLAMASQYLFDAEFYRRGRSRRTSRMPAIGSGNPCLLCGSGRIKRELSVASTRWRPRGAGLGPDFSCRPCYHPLSCLLRASAAPCR